MDRCEGAYQTIPTTNKIRLDPREYPGGVALWGAVEPVINTTGRLAERGIHVHARLQRGGKKKIDRTYDAVELVVRGDLLKEEAIVTVTRDTAVAYYLSRFLNQEIEALFCPHCDTPHLDSDWFAVKQHRTHLCHGCNELFKRSDRSISNPLAAAQLALAQPPHREPKRAKKCLKIDTKDFPGGIQVWASNPAILWTSPAREEAGIHVHAWRKGGQPDPDDTYDAVMIDGILLNEAQLRAFMAQQSLYYLRGKVLSVDCPKCGVPHFDAGASAFRPTKEKTCQLCGERFCAPGRRRLFVSNPFVDTVKWLQRGAKSGKKNGRLHLHNGYRD